jgi:hypothetical protein
MPAALHKSTTINLTADEDMSDSGRIQIRIIRSNGDVAVIDDPDHMLSGEFFTSLDGLTYLPGS